MNAKEFVDSLFEGYEKTEALADLKEELLANLNAKIESFIKKGMDAEAAFAKASAELGDVSSLADEMSLKKRAEVFEEVYMDVRKYMSTGRTAAYVVFGILALFGIITAFITLFGAKKSVLSEFDAPVNWIAFFGTLMPFLTASITGFTFLGVTQETASMYPVSKKRGIWYAAASGLISFGLLLMPLIFFTTKTVFDIAGILLQDPLPLNFESLVPVISMLIPFVLPGIGILVFLILTEKNRLKPWAKSFHNYGTKLEIAMRNDPVMTNRFGLFSGAIWIFAIGLFFLLGYLIGFKFSWLVFIFAVAVQLMVQGFMFKPQQK